MHLRKQYTKSAALKHAVDIKKKSCFWWPPAICMVLISIINIIIYMVDSLFEYSEEYGPLSSQLIYDPYRRYEIWRYFTYMFVHTGSFLLFLRSIVLIFLAISLEMEYKWSHVLFIYMAGIFGGSLATSIKDPSFFLSGSTGGMFALIGAHLGSLIIHWSKTDYPIIHLAILLCMLGVDLGTTIYFTSVTNLDQTILYIPHLAGTITGFCFAIGLFNNFKNNNCQKKLQHAIFIIYFIVVVIAILMNIFKTDYFPTKNIDNNNYIL